MSNPLLTLAIVLSAFGCSTNQTIRELAKQFRIVEYFQRDTPESGLTAPFGVTDHVNDLKIVVDQYTVPEKPIVVGHSWGGVLASPTDSQKHRSKTHPGNKSGTSRLDPTLRTPVQW